MVTFRSAVVLVLLCLAACGGTEQDELTPSDDSANTDIASTEEALIGGYLTNTHPDVGFIQTPQGHKCTATLIAPHTLLTAAHCLDYKTQATAKYYDDNIIYFLIAKPTGPRYDQVAWHRFGISAFVSLGSSLGKYDLAVVRLATAVPASVTPPYKYASVDPPRGAAIADYGYGCNHINADGSGATGGGWQYKRRIDTTLGGPKYFTCPGDSGGPLMNAQVGVFRVNSLFCADKSCPNGFAEVPANHAWIASWVRAWN